MPWKKKNVIGLRFGRLTIIDEIQPQGKNRRIIALCDCGTTSSYALMNVMHHRTRSCGCLQKEVTSATMTTHGHKKNRTVTQEYNTWDGLRTRCNNPRDAAYSNYGGRGITVCERWNKFENFLSDMGRRPPGTSLDRIDNNSGYSPVNCRWVNQEVQQNNKRTNHLITFRGVTKTISEWATELGMHRGTLQSRITDYGWSIQQALTTPLYGKKADESPSV